MKLENLNEKDVYVVISDSLDPATVGEMEKVLEDEGIKCLKSNAKELNSVREQEIVEEISQKYETSLFREDGELKSNISIITVGMKGASPYAEWNAIQPDEDSFKELSAAIKHEITFKEKCLDEYIKNGENGLKNYLNVNYRETWDSMKEPVQVEMFGTTVNKIFTDPSEYRNYVLFDAQRTVDEYRGMTDELQKHVKAIREDQTDEKLCTFYPQGFVQLFHDKKLDSNDAEKVTRSLSDHYDNVLYKIPDEKQAMFIGNENVAKGIQETYKCSSVEKLENGKYKLVINDDNGRLDEYTRLQVSKDFIETKQESLIDRNERNLAKMNELVTKDFKTDEEPVKDLLYRFGQLSEYKDKENLKVQGEIDKQKIKENIDKDVELIQNNINDAFDKQYDNFTKELKETYRELNQNLTEMKEKVESVETLEEKLNVVKDYVGEKINPTVKDIREKIEKTEAWKEVKSAMEETKAAYEKGDWKDVLSGSFKTYAAGLKAEFKGCKEVIEKTGDSLEYAAKTIGGNLKEAKEAIEAGADSEKDKQYLDKVYGEVKNYIGGLDIQKNMIDGSIQDFKTQEEIKNQEKEFEHELANQSHGK